MPMLTELPETNEQREARHEDFNRKCEKAAVDTGMTGFFIVSVVEYEGGAKSSTSTFAGSLTDSLALPPPAVESIRASLQKTLTRPPTRMEALLMLLREAIAVIFGASPERGAP